MLGNTPGRPGPNIPAPGRGAPPARGPPPPYANRKKVNTALRADSAAELSRADMHQYDFGMCAMLAGSKVPGERSEGSWRAGGITVQHNSVGAEQEGDGAPGFCWRNTTPPADTWPADQQQTPRQSPVRPRSRATDSGSDSSSPKAREIEDCYLRSAATKRERVFPLQRSARGRKTSKRE